MRSVLALALILPGAAAADPITYNRDVRPILSDNCFPCHGPDKPKRKAKLRLDVREDAIEHGAIVPGKVTESELITRILLKPGEEGAMPPEAAHKVLTAKQKEIITKWVADGAKYEPHWAYTPLVKPDGRNIDEFIRAELKKRNLTLSPETDRRTLIRRLYLDVTGLPPTVEEVDAFVNDKQSDAYERLVDKLLSREEYGERMAVMWLDQVRFADTVGYHGDQNQRIFPYRDYVIKSFITNKQFDVFTREQLAGDLLSKPTTEQLVATGFNRLNMMTREGGAQPAEYLAKYQADRVRTVSLAWLGSTLGCAECHDHKFDPFTAKDFYSMAAFFADIRQWGVYSDYTYTPNPDLKGWNNDFPFPPEIEVESPHLLKLATEISKQIIGESRLARNRRTAAGIEESKPTEWKKSMLEYLRKNPTGWLPIKTVKNESNLKLAATAAKGATPTFAFKPPPGVLNTLRIEYLPGNAPRGNVTLQVSASLKPKAGKERKQPFFYGTATSSIPIKYSSTEPVEGLLDGWRIPASAAKTSQHAQWQFNVPVTIQEGDELVLTIKADAACEVKVSTSPIATPDIELSEYYLRAFDLHGKQGGWFDSVLEMELLSTASDAEFIKNVKPLIKERESIRRGKAWTQVTVAQKPMTTRVLPRGNFLDETGPVVLPSTPAFLGGSASTEQKRLTRLDLADWIVSKDNPLTARVFVNRLWKMYFGTGLSAGVEDIGAQGEWPSHPELLDWLASEFRTDWNVKRMVKMIVMSDTYKQQSTARNENVDPGNRLLSYLPPRRLEAEFVRDNALAISGLLNRDVYGPSTKPYQPPNYYTNLQFPDRNYEADQDRRQYRRGLYMHWQRTFLHPMLANFDAPSREECTANRTSANTPQQALTLLNDPTFVEAARVLAVKVQAASKVDVERLDWLFKRALSRSPKPAERDTLIAFLGKQRTHYGANPADATALLKVGLSPMPDGDPADLAAWASVCRVVLNLHESITRY